MARKVSKLISDIEWADTAGLATAWMPQVPDDFDLLTMVGLLVIGFVANLLVKPVDARFHEPRPERVRSEEPAMEA